MGDQNLLKINIFDDDSNELEEIQQKTVLQKLHLVRSTDVGTADFLGRVEIRVPLVSGNTTSWFLLRKRGKRSHVYGKCFTSFAVVVDCPICIITVTMDLLPNLCILFVYHTYI